MKSQVILTFHINLLFSHFRCERNGPDEELTAGGYGHRRGLRLYQCSSSSFDLILQPSDGLGCTPTQYRGDECNYTHLYCF